MNLPTIVNIQKFSIHDGDGIRTTVFFKGCPLFCLWCHNPEGQRFSREIMVYPDRCMHCGSCAACCPSHAVGPDFFADPSICTACGRCVDVCCYNAREQIGTQYSVDELVRQITEDTAFYEVSGGGVTFSGGEVLAQDMDYLDAVCRKLKRRGFRIDIDTSGYAPYDRLQRLLPYTDMFLYDIKHMDPEQHLRYTGVDNALILENLRRLSEDGAPINIRMPLIAGVNDNDEEIQAVLDFLQDLSIQRVNLLPYHKAGSDKYPRLHRIYEGTSFAPPDPERMETIRQRFLDAGYLQVKIGG